jgi:hypothetical protein
MVTAAKLIWRCRRQVPVQEADDTDAVVEMLSPAMLGTRSTISA